MGEDQSSPVWKKAAAGATLAAAAGLVLLGPPGKPLHELSHDLLFRLRPDLASHQAVIVYLDDPSARQLGQPAGGPELWDRGLHAKLLRRLAVCGCKAVVFDILFDEPKAGDKDLVEAINAAQASGTKVILGAELETIYLPGKGSSKRTVRPIEALEHAAAIGLAEHGNMTATARRHFEGDPESDLPSLARRAVELSRPPPAPDPGIERWVNYYGPPFTLDYRSFHEVLDPSLDLTVTFSNKVCFVGARPGIPTAGGVRVDECNTPYGTKMPGVELTATVYLNLAERTWLNRFPEPALALMTVLVGAAFGLGLIFCRPLVAASVGATAGLLIAAVAFWLFWRHRLWFPWLIPAAVQLPLAVAWSALAYTERLAREKKSLEQQLATLAPSSPQAPSPAPPSLAADPDASTVAAVPRAGPSPLRPADASLTPRLPDHLLVRRIGRGAYGEVWLARNAIGSYHAVKILRREDFDHSAPFEREFRGLQRFMPLSRSHPGLVQILHVGRHDAERGGFLYYVMEPADDETGSPEIHPDTYSPRNLAKELRRRSRLPVSECLQLGLDLTSALEFLHQHQLVHRDIKPANIIFVQGRPKFADIGLVTEMAGTGREVTYVGTEGYIPPEGPGTPAADLYSLGKVLYQASMGLSCEQFPELPATALQRDDRAHLFQFNEIVLKACRDELSQRYATARSMHEDLLTLQTRLARRS